MSVELAQKVTQLENQLKAMQSQIEVLNAEIQEKVAAAVSWRTNLHHTQKAFKEATDAKVALETKVKDLEEKLKPHLVKDEVAA